MTTPLQPLADNIVAQIEEAQNKTASGLYLPEQATEKPKTAKVLNVGKEVKNIKINDRIVYKSYSATEIKIDKQDYVIVKEEDVLATVK
jgi:chaperonin GroES